MRKASLFFIIVFLSLFLMGCSSLMTEKQKDDEITELVSTGKYSEAKSKVMEYYRGENENKAVGWLMIINEKLEEENAEISDSELEDYMKQKNITLTAKDVQYDMKNNLDKKFAIVGRLTIDDYYNYGFDNSIEADYFSGELEQPNGTYSTNWYLYFHRESFKDLFNILKQRSVEVNITAIIPKYMFEENQGNMAMVESASW